MDELVEIHKALANRNRLRIVALLMDRPMCVCEVRHVLNLAQPTVTRHLQDLQRAGLVRSEKNASWMDYRLAQDRSPYTDALLRPLRKYLASDPQILKDRAAARRTDRRTICAAKPCE